VLARDRLVDRTPVDGGLGQVIPNDELVSWGAAGELARPDYQCAAIRKQPLAPLDDMLDQLRGAEVPKRPAHIMDFVPIEENVFSRA